MFDADAPDPLDRPGPRPWAQRTRQERIAYVLGFAAITGSILLVVSADTPAFRIGVAVIGALAGGWFGLRAWVAAARAVQRFAEGRPVAGAFTAILAAIDLALGCAVLRYAAQIVRT